MKPVMVVVIRNTGLLLVKLLLMSFLRYIGQAIFTDTYPVSYRPKQAEIARILAVYACLTQDEVLKYEAEPAFLSFN